MNNINGQKTAGHLMKAKTAELTTAQFLYKQQTTVTTKELNQGIEKEIQHCFKKYFIDSIL